MIKMSKLTYSDVVKKDVVKDTSDAGVNMVSLTKTPSPIKRIYQPKPQYNVPQGASNDAKWSEQDMKEMFLCRFDLTLRGYLQGDYVPISLLEDMHDIKRPKTRTLKGRGKTPRRKMRRMGMVAAKARPIELSSQVYNVV